MSKEKIDIEDFKELIDSRKQTKTEKKADSKSLMLARLNSHKKSRSEDELILRLYRLKLMMEEEAKTDVLKSEFYTYSSAYVDLLYKTRKSFASDIQFSETQLSLILTGKRPPTDEFVAKIRLHSSKIYQKLNIDFNPSNWFTIYHLDRMNDYLNKHKSEKISFEKMSANIASLRMR
jgi:hypothetical protein